MTQDSDAVAGMELAARAIHAAADGRDDEALAALNGGTHAETAWAAAYMLAALRESVWDRHNKKPVRAALAMHKAADDIGDDVLDTRLALMLEEANRHE